MSIFPPTSSSKTKTGNFWSDWAFQELYMMWNKFWPQKPIFEGSACHFTINPIQPSVFGSKFTRGYNGREVPKLSWNLISYRDWCQTKGFTTFRYLEPPKLMVWKSDFFWWFMRFVRVPPYEIWANQTNFYSSWENGDFFWCQTCCTLFHTQNEEKSQKIGTCIRIHTRVYANTWWWGQICLPPSRIGCNPSSSRVT